MYIQLHSTLFSEEDIEVWQTPVQVQKINRS